MRPAGIAPRSLLLTTALLCGILLLPAPVRAGSVEAGSALAETTVSGYAQGIQAYRIGNYDQATRLFRSVLATDAENVNAHYYLGLSLDFLRMGSEAASEYQYVVAHGREDKIVTYAQQRLSALQAAPASPVASTVAMVAAGNQASPAVYRGSVTKIAVPLKNSRNALMVDATLHNRDAHVGGTFIIDTGATYTSISQELAEKLGIDLSHCETVRITTANGRIDVPKVMIETLNVNGLEAHNVEATVIPVRHGSSFSGLIGLSFIRQFVLTIDPQGGQLIFQKN
ncbi:MAG TPA: retropepsin-like aspartic protease [Coleofasciculaceae cyanobacterium]|jgi:clan AA aspartic protease (TIGR02281 family)